MSGKTLEQIQAELAAAAAPSVPVTKKYYTTTPNSNIHVMRGPGHCEAIQFVGSCLESSDPVVISYMDGIADKSGSGVYTTSPEQIKQETENMQADVRAAAAIAQKKMVDAGLKTA